MKNDLITAAGVRQVIDLTDVTVVEYYYPTVFDFTPMRWALAIELT